MKVRLVTVTPKLAVEWLKKNVRNRPLMKSRVDSYASQITLGRWKVNGETMKFATDGTLIDGQHRLYAIIQANTPIMTYVAEGVAPDAFDSLDRVGPRSLAHAFGRERKKHYNILAAATRCLWLLENGENVQGSRALQIEDGWEVFKRYPQLERLADMASKWKSLSPIPCGQLAAFMTYTHERHGEKVLDFWRMVATGEELKAGDPACVLRRRLEATHESQEVIHRDIRVAICMKAFNAWLHNKKVVKLSYDMSREEMPKFA